MHTRAGHGSSLLLWGHAGQGQVSCCRRIPSQPGAGRAVGGSWLVPGVAPDFLAVVGRTSRALANLGFKHVFTKESSMWHQGSGCGNRGGGLGGPAHRSEPGLWHLLLCHLAISSQGKAAVPVPYRTLHYPRWSVSCCVDFREGRDTIKTGALSVCAPVRAGHGVFSSCSSSVIQARRAAQRADGVGTSRRGRCSDRPWRVPSCTLTRQPVCPWSFPTRRLCTLSPLAHPPSRGPSRHLSVDVFPVTVVPVFHDSGNSLVSGQCHLLGISTLTGAKWRSSVQKQGLT